MHTFTQTFTKATRHASKLTLLAILLAAAAPASAQTPVQFGDTITEPGVYFLLGNQTGTGDGIKIESDDVTLLLLRFTLRGDTMGRGISSDGYDNITIWGGRVTNFGVGIALEDGEDCTVRDMRIDHCRGTGLFLKHIDDSWFLRTRCDYNGRNGVEAVACDDNRFVSILAHNNDFDGILLIRDFPSLGAAGGAGDVDTSDDNKIRLCWAAYNGRDGIRLLDAPSNELRRNQCVANYDAGIRVDTGSAMGGEAFFGETSRENIVEANWCVFNRDGIVVERGATQNTMHENTALANHEHDLVENNDAPPCENTWFLNFFFSKDGDGEDCIF